MACGGFACSRNVLTILNIIYILVALLLIFIASYGKAVAIIATIHVLGGIIACGVFLLLIAIVGLIGAIKHHQVFLFFYMIILFLLFLAQFAVACACLAVSDAQQHELYRIGWSSAADPLKNKTQKFFMCCGYNSTMQSVLDGPLGHPACWKIGKCESNSNAKCCIGTGSNGTSGNTTVKPVEVGECPVRDCWSVIEPNLHQAAKLVGGLGLFFAFTEIIGVILAFRYRNQKDPRANPSAFL